ncbi:MAG: hypothetical protein EPO32_00045 [Anaerolineae bacterium]|nr:MAG: hypothetical protein EPO32_00045 [Anaerolineae bacterium]
MKSQMIRLESHDDVASASDKLDRSQSDRVLLVWPVRPLALRSRLDIQRLHRRAQSNGSRLAIVSRRSDVAHHAGELGIPVFRNIRMAQQIPWESAPENPAALISPRRTSPARLAKPASPAHRPLSGPARGAVFGIGVLAFACLVALLLPRAHLKLEPARQPQSLEIALIADPTLPRFNLSGVLPLKVASVVVEGVSVVPATGETAIPFSASSGEILLTNLTDDAVAVPSGTIIRTSFTPSIRFKTVRAVSLSPTAGSTAIVGIVAESPGTSGNLPAGALDVVEGDLGIRLSASNLEPTSGGQDQPSRAPAPEDYDNLRAALIASLWQSALADASLSDLTPGLILISEPGEIEILEEEFSPPPPQPADELSLRLRVRFSIPYIPADQLDLFARATLDASLSPDFSPLEGTLSTSALDNPSLQADGTYNLVLRLSRTIQGAIPESYLLPLMLGRSPASAIARITESFELQSPPEITLLPAWLPFLPLMPWQITVSR